MMPPIGFPKSPKTPPLINKRRLHKTVSTYSLNPHRWLSSTRATTWIIQNLLTETLDYEASIRQSVFVGINVITSVLCVVWAAVYIGYFRSYLAGLITLMFPVVNFVGLAVLYLHSHKFFEAYCLAIVIMYLLFPTVCSFSMGGNGVLLWSILAPIAAVFLRVRWRFFVVLVFISQTIILLSVDMTVAHVHNTTLVGVLMEYAHYICSGLLLVFVIAYYAEKLHAEKKRGDALLENIFPHSVVTRLKQGESTLVEDIDDASILFADIVNFSAMADTMEAFEVVSMLNVLFSTFDELIVKHHVEKIKTVGDAYMVGSNVSVRNAAHAEALANLAMDMQEKIKIVSLHLHRELHIRIGIATGPLVAGIIGLSTRSFDVYGSTVNLASRMESTGIPDCIQLCEETASRLRESGYSIQERGSLCVKGLGIRKTFLLTGPPTVEMYDNQCSIDMEGSHDPNHL